jgi:hypothetical protein
MFVLCIPSMGNGYEVDTHDHITRNAIMRSVVAEPDMLRALGLEFSIDDRRLTFQNSRNEYRTILELTADGSRYEDGFGCTDTRPTNHFFDPENDRPLTYLFRTWGLRSPDWALEDQQDAEGQEYSLKDALDRFHEAMSLPEKEQRERSFGLLFQTLGHVMHHVQDMAQPEHVRNDAHLVTPCRPNWLPDLFWEDKSLYEHHTNQEEVLRRLPVDGYEIPSASVFNQARKFWVSRGRGMAEFTNSNFVSMDTNFWGHDQSIRTDPEYRLPQGDLGEKVRIEDLLEHNPWWLRGWVQFVRTTVSDGNTGDRVTNERASTYSIFAPDLKQYVDEPFPIFTLNRFNFSAAHEFLMPRAVAYSAGLINHFFRGRMKVADVLDDIDPDSGRPLYRVLIQNESLPGFDFYDGKFEVYFEDSRENRIRAEMLSGGMVGSSTLAVGQSAELLAFAVDGFEPVRLVAVFQGKIGSEDGVAVYVATLEPDVYVLEGDLYDALGRVYRFSASGELRGLLHAPGNAGLTVYDGRLYAADGGVHPSAVIDNDTSANDQEIFVSRVDAYVGWVKAYGHQGGVTRTIAVSPGYQFKGGVVGVAANNQRIATTNNEDLYVYNLDGSQVAFVTGIDIMSQEVDIARDRIYAINGGVIAIYDLDGAHVGTAGSVPYYWFPSIAVTERRLYVTETMWKGAYVPRTNLLHVYRRHVSRDEQGMILSDDYEYERTVDFSSVSVQPRSTSVDRALMDLN